MDKQPPNSTPINKQSTAYERWELPALLESERNPAHATIKLPTLAEIESLRQDAYDEGFKLGQAEGFKQGLTNGLKNGEQRIQQQLKTLIEEFATPMKAQEDRIEKVLLELTLEISKGIIKRELSIDSTCVLTILEHIFTEIDDQEQKFRIQLNPMDLNTVSQYLLSQHGDQARYQLIEDKKITQGGCIVRSDAHYIDVRIETRLKKALDQVYERSNGLLAPDSNEARLEPENVLDLNDRAETKNTESVTPVVAASDATRQLKKADLSAMPFFDNEAT
jgi:flagellar assembly protein FliH